MSNTRYESLLALTVAVLPLSLAAQDTVPDVPAGDVETHPAVTAQAQFHVAAPMSGNPAEEGNFRPMAPEDPGYTPPDNVGYDMPTDPGEGWSREGDYAYGDYGHGGYGQDDGYWGDPGYGYSSGYSGGYRYPENNLSYRQPMHQDNYYPEMRGGYRNPYASSGYVGVAPRMSPPEYDYHHETIQRLDAIVDRLERIEKAMLNKGG